MIHPNNWPVVYVYNIFTIGIGIPKDFDFLGAIMFLIRRVCKVERKDCWQVAKLLRDICNSYEENTGRGKATVYIGGAGTPADEFTVCAEWKQETIDANRMPNVPQSVLDANAEMFPLITDYKIEFFEVATDDKLAERF